MNTALVLFALGPGQIVLILLVVLLLFGGRKIPELMKGLGTGIKGLKTPQKKKKKRKGRQIIFYFFLKTFSDLMIASSSIIPSLFL